MIINDELLDEIDKSAERLLYKAKIITDNLPGSCLELHSIDFEDKETKSSFLNAVNSSRPKTVPAILLELEAKNHRTPSEVVNGAELDSGLYSNITSGHRKASEKYLYRLSLYHHLTMQEACELFTAAGHNLSLKTPDHVALLKFIEEEEYDVGKFIDIQQLYEDRTRRTR